MISRPKCVVKSPKFERYLAGITTQISTLDGIGSLAKETQLAKWITQASKQRIQYYYTVVESHQQCAMLVDSDKLLKFSVCRVGSRSEI